MWALYTVAMRFRSIAPCSGRLNRSDGSLRHSVTLGSIDASSAPNFFYEISSYCAELRNLRFVNSASEESRSGRRSPSASRASTKPGTFSLGNRPFAQDGTPGRSRRRREGVRHLRSLGLSAQCLPRHRRSSDRCREARASQGGASAARDRAPCKSLYSPRSHSA